MEGHAGRTGARQGRFAYFVDPELPSFMIETSELGGGKGEYFQQIRAASLQWDGREPVRWL